MLAASSSAVFSVVFVYIGASPEQLFSNDGVSGPTTFFPYNP